MRWFKILFVLFIVSSNNALAEPFLVCDAPDESERVELYKISGLDNYIETVPDVTGEYGIKHDLVGLAHGTYTVTAVACNKWECSEPSAPFVFTRPLPPAKPAGVTVIFGN